MPGHGGLNPDMADIGTNSIDLEQAFEAKRAAARGEFNVTRKMTMGARSDESTMLLSRRATITLIASAVALCALVFGIQYGAAQLNLRTHPHHWYAVHLHIPVSGHRSSYAASQGITLTGADGPYATRDACEKYLKTQTSEYEYFDTMACREMTDADATAVQRPNP